MSLQEQITEDWKVALKGGLALRKETLSGLRAAIKNAEIESQCGIGALDDNGILRVLEREAKKRRDAIEEYSRVGRDDRAQGERDELAIIQEYLPPPLSPLELEELVRAAITQAGATSPQQMGAVMKLLQPQVAGRADGKTISETVRRLLAS